MDRRHQRVGSKSNAHVGREFERLAGEFFAKKSMALKANIKIRIGISNLKKEHAFDLGCEDQKILVEYKSHKWTAPNENVPSAKLTVWNEAMYYFYLAPPEYRKIFFVLKDYSAKRKETLAEYYMRTHAHLIPDDVEIWEYDEQMKTGNRLTI